MEPGLKIFKKWNAMLIRQACPFGAGYPLKARSLTRWGASEEIPYEGLSEVV